MSVRRVMGTEVEYGISVPGQPGANPMVTSSQIVNAYGAREELARGGRARWDYEEESPLRDARGFTYSGALYDPAEAMADEDLGLANVILTNGARLYVDHAHPEYSTPEVTNPRDAVVWDKAGEWIMAEAARHAATVPGSLPINLYKNNTDNKGASYGSHENYLMARTTPFADIVRHLTPFFVSRQVVTGAGRVGLGQDGGAHLSEVSMYLKMGTTSLVLAMIEDRFISMDFSVDQPVKTLHQVSHDPSLKHLVTLRSGRKLTAVQLQMEYFEQARKYVEDKYGTDVDEVTRDVLDRWESVLSRLETDPMSLSRELDWVAKLEILEGYRKRDAVDWDNARLQLVDLQYADVRPAKG